MNIFGNTGGTGTGPSNTGGLFGNNAGTNPAAPNPPSALFGGPTVTSATPGTGLFGGAPAQPSGGLFGNATGTPAAAPAPAAGGGLFGSNNATAAAQPAGGLFGKSSSVPALPTGSLFGGATNTSNAPLTGGLFGGAPPAATTSTTPANPPNLFAAFGQPQPAAQSAAAKTTPTSLFPAPPATTATSSTQPIGTPAGGLFPGPKPAEASAPAASTSAPAAAPTGNLFGGGLFGQKPNAPAAAAPTATAAATGAQPATSAFSLGGNTTAPSAAPAAGPSAAPAAASAFALGGAGASKPEEKKDGPTPAQAFGLFGGPKPDATKKDTPAAGAATAAQTGTAAPAAPAAASTAAPAATTSTAVAPTISVPPPSVLRGKTIEEIVNRWAADLETHVREFNQFSTEVAVWDRALIENSNNLAALYAAVLAAEREQSDIDQSLDHIEQQQKELSTTLEAYEKLTDEILGSQGGSLRALDTGPADTERDKNYMLATELHGHLDDLSASLTQMIESVNELSLAAEDKASDDPMGQIAQILSSHLESLQWIDGAVREVETKVGDVEKRIRASDGAGVSAGGGKSRGYGVVGR